MPRVFGLLSLLAVSVAAPAAAVLDQSQEVVGGGHSVHANNTVWQTFTPGVSGRLSAVELQLTAFCVMPPCFGTAPELNVEIVETAAGIPTGIVLAAAVLPGGGGTAPPAWIALDFSDQVVELAAGTSYGMRLTSSGSNAPESIHWSWFTAPDTNPYPGGGFFADIDPGDGLDDPAETPPNSDGTFRTFMDVCGDDVVGDTEECDDGNATGGDGCSASCLAEVCGDGIVTGGAETCDDGASADGDGCSAQCALEKTGLACQRAIAKAGHTYASARLAALQKCRLALAAGKALSVTTPADCPQESAAAKRIEKAAAQARKAIAGRKPRCSDALLAALGACADTVDALIGPDASDGCLRDTHDAAVEALLEALFGY